MTKIAAALICLTLPLAAANAQDSVQSFPASGLRAFHIHTESGDIHVAGGDALDIKVSIVNSNPDTCAITMVQDGETLRLKAEGKRKWFWKSNCEAGFEVQTPKRLSLEASSGSGNMQVSGLDGALGLRIGSGNIQVEGASGDLNAKLGSGDLKGRALSGNAEVRAGSGNVDLAWARSPGNPSVDIKAGSGDINLAWAQSPEAGQVDIKVGSGNASLKFPNDVKLHTQLLTGSGAIHNEIGDTPSAKLLIAAIAGSGDITIGKLAK